MAALVALSLTLALVVLRGAGRAGELLDAGLCLLAE